MNAGLRIGFNRGDAEARRKQKPLLSLAKHAKDAKKPRNLVIQKHPVGV